MEHLLPGWYTVNNIAELDTPALVVYPERIKHNLQLLKTMIDEADRLRPHIKTHKCPEVVSLTMAAGIFKFKCATIAEAEMLGNCQAPDVLLAYQPAGPKLTRFIALIRAYPLTRFSCLVDNIKSAGEIALAMAGADLQANVYIDLNVGMNRTGIVPGIEALQLYQYAGLTPGINPIGLHAYDGHIHDRDLAMRTSQCNTCFAAVEKLRQDIINEGYNDPVIIAGGTPTFPIHAKRKNVECSPGTFIYWDKGYGDAFTEQPFLPAALIVTRVISCPDASSLCLDAGHKSVSAENPLNKRISFLNAPGLVPVSQSEEHLVVAAGEGHHYKIGDILYGIPHHICPTVALYERAGTIENNRLTGEWFNIARDRKLTI